MPHKPAIRGRTLRNALLLSLPLWAALAAVVAGVVLLVRWVLP